MKIVSYNIQFGPGKDNRFDLERIASEIDGADIIDTWVAAGYGEDEGVSYSYCTSCGEVKGVRLDYAIIDES